MSRPTRRKYALRDLRILEHYFYPALALFLLGTETACSTVNSRIDANHAVFDQLPPDQKAVVRSGKVGVGYGAAAVSLAYGEPRYVTYESEPLEETNVVHSLGDFMIPASNLTKKIDVWHYQGPSLKRIVD